jgi:hypothetical protein
MAFLVRSVDFLRPNGETLCLLPAGCLDSQRDSAARRLLASLGEVKVLEGFERGSFAGCAHRTVLVRIRLSSQRTEPGRLLESVGGLVQAAGVTGAESTPLKAEIVRGSIQMHERASFLDDGGIPFVHSTDLIDGRVHDGREELVRTSRSRAMGPAVLLPRVGTPATGKVCVFGARAELALSDCVIAVQFARVCDANDVRRRLTNGHWQDLDLAYSGTCARFITVARLIAALRSVGVDASFAGRTATTASDDWRC